MTSRLVLMILLLPPLTYAGFIGWQALFFRGEVCCGIRVQQRALRNIYDLVDEHGRLLIPDVDDWIIKDGMLYGSREKAGYFALMLPERAAISFGTLRELNQFLVQRNVPPYKMSDAESVVDIQYARGRHRKY